MNFSNEKISFRQLIGILVLEIFSTSFLSLPKILYSNTKHDSWLFLFISGTIAYISISLYLYLYKKTNSKTFKEFLDITFGPLSKIIIFIFICKNLLFISFELNYFIDLVQNILLKNTSKISILIFVLLSAYYFSKKGIETRGRLAEFLILPVFIAFITFFIVASINADFTNIFPILQTTTNYKDMANTVFFGLMAFSGLEYIFILVPFLKKQEKFHKASLYVLITTTLFISLTTLLTIAVFNHQILLEKYPVIMILNSISLPFDFIERQDSLVFILWIIGSFFTVSAGFFYSSLLFKDLTPHKKYIDEVLVVIVFSITIFFTNYVNETTIGTIVFLVNLIYLVFLPIISFAIHTIRSLFINKKTEENYENF
ncbi:MAG: endospore germination permease [Lachnospirales bacterium]